VPLTETNPAINPSTVNLQRKANHSSRSRKQQQAQQAAISKLK